MNLGIFEPKMGARFFAKKKTTAQVLFSIWRDPKTWAKTADIFAVLIAFSLFIDGQGLLSTFDRVDRSLPACGSNAGSLKSEHIVLGCLRHFVGLIGFLPIGF